MDYCVQCWDRNRQRVAATKSVEDDPLCDVHAKEAGDSPVKVETPLGTVKRCLCGKPHRHKGRCTGYSKRGSEIVNVAQPFAEPAGQTVYPLPTPSESILAAPNAPPYVTLTVTETALDNFWMKLPVSEKAKIVEGMLR